MAINPALSDKDQLKEIRAMRKPIERRRVRLVRLKDLGVGGDALNDHMQPPAKNPDRAWAQVQRSTKAVAELLHEADMAAHEQKPFAQLLKPLHDHVQSIDKNLIELERLAVIELDGFAKILKKIDQDIEKHSKTPDEDEIDRMIAFHKDHPVMPRAYWFSECIKSNQWWINTWKEFRVMMQDEQNYMELQKAVEMERKEAAPRKARKV